MPHAPMPKTSRTLTTTGLIRSVLAARADIQGAFAFALTMLGLVAGLVVTVAATFASSLAALPALPASIVLGIALLALAVHVIEPVVVSELPMATAIL